MDSLIFTVLDIVAQHISKRFGQEWIIRDFSYEFHAPGTYALLGPNGSGKSTLLQMLAGFLSSSSGGVLNYQEQGKVIDESERHQYIAYAAPYLELIEELTLLEFLHYHFTFKKSLLPISELLALVGLEAHANKYIRQFSSGMKQRVKLMQSIGSDTPILFLDEPCTNLDQDGIQLYHQLVQRFSTHRLVMVASNDPQEYDFCEHHLRIQA